MKRPSMIFQVVSVVNRNREGFHFNSFARQSLNWSCVVSFHAVAKTKDAGIGSKTRRKKVDGAENKTYDRIW